MRKMSNRKYELLMKEIDAIIAKVEQLPDSVRELVFHALVGALLDKDSPEPTETESGESEATPAKSPSATKLGADDATIESEFKSFYAEFEGVKLNDMEFCALAAQFFTQQVSPPARVDAIGPQHLRKAVRLAGRREPSNAATTLNNAKNVKGYLESAGKSVYGLTELGERFVRSTSRAGSDLVSMFQE